jgi:aspartyl-tRNA(Asn)/glutamyl-tRNA(Gln) amidotransferase subunit C
MMDVNEKLTRQVAHLARLELSQSEVQVYTAQLKQILEYVETLKEVDVHGIEPMIHPIPLNTELREDFIQEPILDSEGKSLILSAAPEVLFDGFKVPPILS